MLKMEGTSKAKAIIYCRLTLRHEGMGIERD